MKYTSLVNLLGKTAAVVSAGLLLSAIATGGYFGVRSVAGLFGSLERSVANVTAIGSVVALVSAWMIARAIGAASRRSRAAAIRDEKAATYQLLLDFWVDQLQQEAPRGTLSPDMTRKLAAIDRLLALYGDASVLAAHTRLRDDLRRHPDGPIPVARVLIAIRKDLGADTPAGLATHLDRLLFPEREVVTA